ncbi:activated protein kinase subunit beta [Seminavis robusta]|uniref:Activated protein kinase subunit beta n=1 Tax=Seminavis robusta TaxID=568900 RepID=A0A9N8HND9_9STRA|nr:activated protein kinase subunit beta [Seminavis robusta]|eukprot:Sro1075_g238420.1 activated protein kinase subunit beta (331) ;mRNA; r:14449-15441
MGNQPSGPGGQGGGGGGGSHGHQHHGAPDPRSGRSGNGYGYNLPPGGVSHSYHGTTATATPQDPTQQLQRSSSDASMTMLDEGTSSSAPVDPATIESFLNDDTVPTVFRWEHGGRQVYITGTFNGWSRQIPMHRSGNDFTYIHNLKRGKHAFKFIVDDEWRFAPDQPTVADIEGRINNFIDVTDFKAYTGDREFEKEKAAAEYGSSHIDTEALAGEDKDAKEGKASTTTTAEEDDPKDKPDRDGEVFSNTMPDMDDYTKEPPPLPPHLRHIILNKPPQLQDTAALPVPQHVALNHLYCTAIKDNMMVLGITQRYKTKFVTTVYYSPCASK